MPLKRGKNYVIVSSVSRHRLINYRKQWLVANETVILLRVLSPATKHPTPTRLRTDRSVSEVRPARPPTGSARHCNVHGSTTENTRLQLHQLHQLALRHREARKVTPRSLKSL
jgi:hypothetical protein